MSRSRLFSILLALLVTFIWSMSWVLIKIGLEDIPPLTFAGLRYSIGAGVLLALVLGRAETRSQAVQLTRRHWRDLVLLGLVYYTLTQGAIFFALELLPAVTLSLMLVFTTVFVTLFGIVLGEFPDRREWAGIALFIVGAVVYFGPSVGGALSLVGLAFGVVAVISNAGASVIGRSVNGHRQLSATVVTAVSMTLGAVPLLVIGLLTEPIAAFGARSWGIILWLAVVHTAFAFTAWNQTLRHLQAFESSLINNTVLIQIAVLGWVFLGEGITPVEMVGLAIAVVGTLVVYVRPNAEVDAVPPTPETEPQSS